MVGLYCAVSGCKNNLAKCRSLGSDITFHRFPTDPSLREIWTESCNRGSDWKKQNVFMCSEHFTQSDFHSSTTGTGQRRTHLVRGAVPSRNLPASCRVCCAVGCYDAPPEILVRRFPMDIARRTELLGGVPRKQGIAISECYLCEKHLALKQFLKDEVGKIACATKKETDSNEAASDIVILEVSKIDGRHSTKLIEPPAKRRRVRFQLEGAESVTNPNRADVLENIDIKTEELGKCDPVRDETLKSREILTQAKRHQPSLVNAVAISSSVSLASSNSGQDPLPVLVKNGDTSQLMFLHPSPHLHASSKPKMDLDFGVSGKLRKDLNSESRPCSMSEPTINKKSTGDLLIDRLYRRIQELEERIVSQRERYKVKMIKMESQHSSKVRALNSRLKELKSEVQSFNKMHQNIAKNGRSSLKPSPSSSDEVQQILGRSFTSNQIKKITNESEPVRWTHAELLNAYTLKHLSYGAYTFVRNHLKYPLPSLKYMRRWMSKIEKERLASNPITDGDVQQSRGSESDNESDEELDVLVAGSSNPDNSSGQFTLEHPCSLNFGRENLKDEEMREDDLHDSKEILIIADPDCTSSGHINISTRCVEPDNGFDVYYALDSSRESLHSPRVYVLDSRNVEQRSVEGDQTNTCSDNLNDCELELRSSSDDTERFEQVLIVEEAEERSHGAEE